MSQNIDTDPTTWTIARGTAEGLGLPDGAAGTLRELEGIVVYVSQSGLTVFDGSRPRVISDAVKDRMQGCRNYVPLEPGAGTSEPCPPVRARPPSPRRGANPAWPPEPCPPPRPWARPCPCPCPCPCG